MMHKKDLAWAEGFDAFFDERDGVGGAEFSEVAACVVEVIAVEKLDVVSSTACVCFYDKVCQIVFVEKCRQYLHMM